MMLDSSTMNIIERKINALEDGHVFDIQKAFVHLVRIALQGSQDDVAALARQYLRRIEPGRADLKEPLAAAMELAAAGCTLLQYRNKSGNARQMLEEARELRARLGTTVKASPAASALGFFRNKISLHR